MIKKNQRKIPSWMNILVGTKLSAMDETIIKLWIGSNKEINYFIVRRTVHTNTYIVQLPVERIFFTTNSAWIFPGNKREKLWHSYLMVIIGTYQHTNNFSPTPGSFLRVCHECVEEWKIYTDRKEIICTKVVNLGKKMRTQNSQV